MSVLSAPTTWMEANQRFLAAEFARLRARLSGDGTHQAAGLSLDEARAAMPAPAAIDELVAAFRLTSFERDLLLLCAAVEMDGAMAMQYAVAGSDGKVAPTFARALATLEEAHWSALAPVGPLRQWRLIEFDSPVGSGSVSQASLRIDERILHFLAGVNYLDTRLRGLVEDVAPPPILAAPHRETCDAAKSVLQQSRVHPSPVMQLVGDDSAGQRDLAAQLASDIGRPAFVLRAEDVPSGRDEAAALSMLWDREAVLLGAVLIVIGDESPLSRQARRFIDEIHGPTIVCAPHPQPIERASQLFTVDKPPAAEQRALWTRALGDTALPAATLDSVAVQFRFSARRIADEGAQLASVLETTSEPEQELWRTCRSMARTRLDELAHRIDARATWADLILPEPQKRTLTQIATHVRHRLLVYDDWGFAERGTRGLGISAVFAGESGTGKTMAAEVLGNELRLDVYRIDLSSVVSKYIGETEKNLRRVFDAAEESGAILLFDEADALFGKRSEVKDSHDRYANIEVSYLLQRMEAYRGLAVLTTNHKSALDPAFQRRIQFVVQFPFPDESHREAIWRSVFPERTPIEELDYGRLARLNMAGGNIRNIALAAAFRAADDQRPVSMAHLRDAAHLEASKGDRALSEAETRGWV